MALVVPATQADATPVDDLVHVLHGLVADDRHDDWTADGRPTTAALAAAVGRPVSATERDAAWAEYQARIHLV